MVSCWSVSGVRCQVVGGVLLVLSQTGCTPQASPSSVHADPADAAGVAVAAKPPGNCDALPLLHDDAVSHRDTLLACAMPTSADSPRPFPALFPEESLEQLRRFEAGLEGCAGRSWNEAQVPCTAPVWMTGSTWADGDVNWRRLADLVARAPTARLRGIALLWLGAGRDPEALPAVEAQLDSSEPAGELPQCTPHFLPQSFGAGGAARPPPHNCSMHPFTVGELALRAVNAITWGNCRTHAEYRAWRKDNPELRKSRAYYGRLFERYFQGWSSSGVSSHLCRIAELRDQDPELFFQVALGHLDGAPQRDLVRIAREHIGTEKLLAMLRDPGPLNLAPTVQHAFDVWALDHWAWLFGSCRSDELLALWTGGHLPAARGELAVAASRAHPQARRSILEAAFEETSYHRLVATELAELYLETDEAAFVRLYENERGRAPALAALRRVGSAQRAVLGKLLQRVPIQIGEPWTVSEIFATAHVLGVARLPCEGRLQDEGTGPMDVDKSGPHREVTNADRQRGTQRRRQCLAELQKLLRAGPSQADH